MPSLSSVITTLFFMLPSIAVSADGAASFETQMPTLPGTFDAPATSTHTCIIPVSPLVVKWREPAAGVTTATGLIVALPGISDTFDCDRFFDAQDAAWPDAKNVVVCNVFYRNNTFEYPYDFGKFQVTDVLRGLGKMLEIYPQVDRKRLYLYGASGGGHVSLQVLQASRHLWAEVHVHCAITLISTTEDVQNRGYDRDALGDGFHDELRFPIVQGNLSNREFARFQAERALRSPQKNVRADLPSSPTSEYPFVWSMHGTNDEGVDVQHFHDMRSAVQQALGLSAAPTTVLGGQRWALQRWTFYSIDGGNHHYAGGHASVNTFNKATNYHVPTAFTRSRPTAPAPVVDYAFPWQHGWRFRVEGALSAATVTTEAQPGACEDWAQYQ